MLPRHPRRDDVRAVLVEADARNVGFDEIAFDAPDTSALTGVGVNRLGRGPAAGPPGPGHRLFTFRAQ